MDKRLLFFSAFILISVSLFAALFVFFKNFSAVATEDSMVLENQASGQNLLESPIDSYFAENSGPSRVLAAIGKGDSRPVIVDNFLARHSSPMVGLGGIFVSTADKYGLDYRLLPAIAFQESILGKKIPKNSHNAWGWAIYTGENSGASFKNWSQAIEIVARGLKYDYIDRGLHTPEAIMTRYTDSNDGSWAYGVNFAMEEMNPH